MTALITGDSCPLSSATQCSQPVQLSIAAAGRMINNDGTPSVTRLSTPTSWCHGQAAHMPALPAPVMPLPVMMRPLVQTQMWSPTILPVLNQLQPQMTFLPPGYPMVGVSALTQMPSADYHPMVLSLQLTDRTTSTLTSTGRRTASYLSHGEESILPPKSSTSRPDSDSVTNIRSNPTLVETASIRCGGEPSELSTASSTNFALPRARGLIASRHAPGFDTCDDLPKGNDNYSPAVSTAARKGAVKRSRTTTALGSSYHSPRNDASQHRHSLAVSSNAEHGQGRHQLHGESAYADDLRPKKQLVLRSSSTTEVGQTCHQLFTDVKKRRAGSQRSPTAFLVLNQWVERHHHCPYPTKEEKAHLLQVTGLTSKQLQDFFGNKRRSMKHNQLRANSRPSDSRLH